MLLVINKCYSTINLKLVVWRLRYGVCCTSDNSARMRLSGIYHSNKSTDTYLLYILGKIP